MSSLLWRTHIKKKNFFIKTGEDNCISGSNLSASSDATNAIELLISIIKTFLYDGGQLEISGLLLLIALFF